MKKDKRLTAIAILCKAPLSDCVPNDVRQWLEEQNWFDMAIAEAMAAVGKKSGWLHHELNDPDNDAEMIEKYSNSSFIIGDVGNEIELLKNYAYCISELNKIAERVK